MTAYFAAYKGPGKITDKAVRVALSLRHRRLVPYSHIEILKGFPIKSLIDPLPYQDCIAASRRDDSEVRQKWIHFRPGHWDFIRIELTESDDVWHTARTSRLGKPYDTLGAALCVTPCARLDPKTDWCSAMIADILGWENPESYDPYMVVQKALSLGGKVFPG